MTKKGRAKLIKQSLEKLDKEELNKIEAMTNSLLAVQKEGDKLLEKTSKKVERNYKNKKKEQEIE